jgi:4-amino-4-deoxy-L-arabinose transferase-like glycosyltransferase
MRGRIRLRRTLYDGVLPWLEQHARACWIGLLLLAVALRALLIYYSPRPDGYVYDFYSEAIELVDTRRRLPDIPDCWQCYHPPLYYIVGWIFYRIGYLLSGTREGALHSLTALSLLGTTVAGWYSIKLLQFFRQRGAYLLLGGAIVVAFPCLFIASWGAEADSVQAALMAASLYYLTRYDTGVRGRPLRLVLLLGVLAGLAMATKHNGLVALAATGAVLFVRLLVEPQRLRTVRDGLIILAIALSLGVWKYVDNYRQYGRPIVANISLAEGFVFGAVPHWQSYEYVSLRFLETIRLYQPDAPEGRLTDQPVYYSVLTSMHAQAWTDMSFFSVRTRHGDPSQPYPDKPIPRALVGAMLVLGLIPGLLALTGLLSTLDRRAFRACTTLVLLSAATYTWWFAGQDIWSLKTKYLLYLLPAYAVYVVVGLRVVRRWRPTLLPNALLAGLVLLIAVTHLFLYAFATGSASLLAR